VTIEISMARLKRWGLSAALWVALAAVAVEAAGAAYFYWANGGLIYRNAEADRPAEPAAARKYRQRLHPYFGFTGPYDQLGEGSLRTNNLGFAQRGPMSVPFVPRRNDLVVAVFGGSVAESLALSLTGGLWLRNSLQALPALAGKRRVVILNMAQGAGKQPQQLIGLAYLMALGQRVDVVINVDGFNEFALGYQNYASDLDPILPSVQRMKPLAMEMYRGLSSAEYYGLASRMLSARQALAEYSDSMRRARTGIGLTHAAVLAAWHRMMLSRYTRKYEAFFIQPNDWNDLREELGLDLSPRTAGQDVFESIFDVWLRCSQQMKMLAAANGAVYLHVVQPNAFYTRHAITRRESAATLSHFYNVGIKSGYALLAERAATLRSNGIVSAVELFDDEPEPVYEDNCCHYTPTGETLLVQFITAQLERQLTATASVPRPQ
jgi:hypothetical protein